jgi:hypothetical protein
MAVKTRLQLFHVDPLLTVVLADRIRLVLVASIACIVVIAGYVTGRAGYFTAVAMI